MLRFFANTPLLSTRMMLVTTSVYSEFGHIPYPTRYPSISVTRTTSRYGFHCTQIRNRGKIRSNFENFARSGKCAIVDKTPIPYVGHKLTRNFIYFELLRQCTFLACEGLLENTLYVRELKGMIFSVC